MITMFDFRRELLAQISRAAKQGRPHIEINAGELHRVSVGTIIATLWPAEP